mmetsp:Transcript_31244/g.81053  ORF Transcript_31244/g.81053 Transcript_31244/m.81053 type:complete len:306 (-) Transcript_31244:712-1629(-)
MGAKDRAMVGLIFRSALGAGDLRREHPVPPLKREQHHTVREPVAHEHALVHPLHRFLHLRLHLRRPPLLVPRRDHQVLDPPQASHTAAWVQPADVPGADPPVLVHRGLRGLQLPEVPEKSRAAAVANLPGGLRVPHRVMEYAHLDPWEGLPNRPRRRPHASNTPNTAHLRHAVRLHELQPPAAQDQADLCIPRAADHSQGALVDPGRRQVPAEVVLPMLSFGAPGRSPSTHCCWRWASLSTADATVDHSPGLPQSHVGCTRRKEDSISCLPREFCVNTTCTVWALARIMGITKSSTTACTWPRGM